MSTTNYTAVKAMFLILPRHGHVSDAPCCVKEARLKRVSGYKAIYGTIWKGQNDSNRRHKRWPGFGSRKACPQRHCSGTELLCDWGHGYTPCAFVYISALAPEGVILPVCKL